MAIRKDWEEEVVAYFKSKISTLCRPKIRMQLWPQDIGSAYRNSKLKNMKQEQGYRSLYSN